MQAMLTCTKEVSLRGLPKTDTFFLKDLKMHMYVLTQDPLNVCVCVGV